MSCTQCDAREVGFLQFMAANAWATDDLPSNCKVGSHGDQYCLQTDLSNNAASITSGTFGEFSALFYDFDLARNDQCTETSYGSTATWSIAIYAATDEEDLDRHSAPLIKEMMDFSLPSNLELLIENDSFSNGGVTRFTRKTGATPTITKLNEHDSASQEAFGSFLKWANETSTGTNKLLLIVTHSWGWRGIIQDYTIPGQGGADTMMPLRIFAKTLKESPVKFDVIVMDACVLGNVEPIDEFRDISRYLVLSQRETPYGGVPFQGLVDILKNKEAAPREVAMKIPREYVSAYSHGGYMAPVEGEYDIVTLVTLDMQKWDHFVNEYSTFVSELKKANFRKFLARDPDTFEDFTDTDSNLDLVEFLYQLPKLFNNQAVARRASSLLSMIGYPQDQAAPITEKYTFTPDLARSIKIYIEADPNLKGEGILSALTDCWAENNQDLEQPGSLEFKIVTKGNGKKYLLVSYGMAKEFSFRPWLPGVTEVEISYQDRSGSWQTKTIEREKDYFYSENFPDSSFLLAETHTQGAPFIHGIGITFKPLMDEEEQQGLDPITGLKGPDFYKITSWNKRTGWGDLILLK